MKLIRVKDEAAAGMFCVKQRLELFKRSSNDGKGAIYASKEGRIGNRKEERKINHQDKTELSYKRN